MVRKSDEGFSLIELMIVLVIMAILATFAYPTYLSYRERTNRADVQSYMMSIAQQLEQYKVTNQSYAGAEIINLGGANYPKNGQQLYSIAVRDINGKLLTDADANIKTWQLMATPLTSGSMKNNGVICLNNESQKFWAKGANGCVFSPTSNWDGR